VTDRSHFTAGANSVAAKNHRFHFLPDPPLGCIIWCK
jgi:hypothetical protein